MRIVRKPRLQGIYAWPARQRQALDEMLDRNLTYEQIIAALAEQGIETSHTAVSAYYGQRIKRAVSAAVFATGAKTLISDGSLTITVSVPDGFAIKASVAEGSAINVNVTQKELTADK